MPKMTLSIDIGPDKQKFDFPAEFVDAATEFIATQTTGTPPVPKYVDVHALLVAHIETLADSLLDMYPQKAAVAAKTALETAQATLKSEREKYRKSTKV